MRRLFNHRAFRRRREINESNRRSKKIKRPYKKGL